MKNLFSLILLSLFSTSLAWSQVVTKGIITINGGQFGNPANNVNLTLYDPATGLSTLIDTIQTQSTQDLLVDGTSLYVAAQDSIVKYDLTTGERLAATAFGAPSTISLALYEDYLIAGNWYAPFGFTGPYQNHLRIFDRETLAFVDSLPALTQPAKDLLVLGDTLYVTQNFTSSTFADSAGWVVKIDLATLTVADSLALNQNGEDVGRFLLQDSVIYTLNGSSNTVSTLDLSSGQVATQAANADLQPSSYNSRIVVDEQDRLFTVIDGDIYRYDLATLTPFAAPLIDTAVTAFTYDTVGNRFYVTQTDFATFTRGLVYEGNGDFVGEFPVGFSPEVIGTVYNALPVAQNDQDSLLKDEEAVVAVLANDSDADAKAPLALSILTSPTQGTAEVVTTGDSIAYLPALGFVGKDSLEYAITDEWGDEATAWVIFDVSAPVSNEASLAMDFQLFPNPASDRLQLRWSQPWSGSLEIVDLNGRTLARRVVSRQSELSWPVEDLPAGVYLIRGQTGKQAWQRRWIKQ